MQLEFVLPLGVFRLTPSFLLKRKQFCIKMLEKEKGL